MKKKRGKPRSGSSKPKSRAEPAKLRIVSGSLRNSKVQYNGDPGTRPMKERTREAVFSLLGGKLPDYFVVDMFAGTGILAFESISRGAASAVVLELARPAIASILANINHLGISDALQVQNVDTLRWLRSVEQHAADWPRVPWVIFCCPPYRMWAAESEAFREGLLKLYALCPSRSQILCETDDTYDITQEIPELEWDVRNYPPAYIGLCTKDPPPQMPLPPNSRYALS